MDKIRSITFDKEAQDNLPKWIKDKMRKDRKQAEAEQLNLHGKKPNWCPHIDCKFKTQTQNKMCVGKLPKQTPHNNDFNDHRLCIDTRENGHGIFDLQINWTDCWNLKRLLDTVRK